MISLTFLLFVIKIIILFFFVIMLLVMIHELGHFLAAKISKMRVDEFAFGFPPRVFGKKIGETTYAFNALPIGGYVKIAGEDFEDEMEGKKSNDPRLFSNRPKILQIFVLLAGVAMNFLLAFVLLSYISYGEKFISSESPDFNKYKIENAEKGRESSKVRVSFVTDNSPAKAAGLEVYDEIIAIRSTNKMIIPTNATSVVRFIYDNQNNPITINFKKYKTGEIATSTVSAVYGLLPDKKSVGFASGEVIYVKIGLIDAIINGATDTYNYTKLTITGVGDLVKKIVNNESIRQDVAGPIGIASLVGKASEEGLDPLLFFVAVISINLGVFNLLPLPALDGGRILFVLYEAIMRRRMNIKFQLYANLIGFGALMLLMLFVSYFDIVKLFN